MFHLEFNRNQLQLDARQEQDDKSLKEDGTEEKPTDPDTKTTVNVPNRLTLPSNDSQTEETIPAKKMKVEVLAQSQTVFIRMSYISFTV